MTKRLVRFLIVPAFMLLAGTGCIQFTGGGTTGNDGGVYKSADKGATWLHKAAIASVGTPRSMAGENVTALAADPSDSKALYAGTENGLFFTYDGGDSWQGAGSLGRVRIASVGVNPSDKCMIYAATGGRVVRSSDCSRTWQEIYVDTRAGTQITAVAVDFFNPTVVYAATSQGDLLKSGDGGGSWSTIYRFDSFIRQLLMTAADSRTIYVVTQKGVSKTTDGGSTWKDLTPAFGSFAGALDEVILAESVSKPNSLVAASHYGLLKTEDGGDTWKAIPLVTPAGSTVIYALAVSPKDGNAIYYGTINTFYRTTDGGAKWVTERLPTSRAGVKLMVDPSNDGVLYMGTAQIQKK